jgi:hypothetical protein
VKQATVIAILGFFLFDSAGFYFFSENKIMSAKSEAEEVIHSGTGDLVAISVSGNSSAQISWRGSREFRYKNKMYDVVYSVKKADQTIYYCL